MTAQDAIDLSDERIENLRDLARRDQMMRLKVKPKPVSFDSMGQDSRMAALLEECEG